MKAYEQIYNVMCDIEVIEHIHDEISRFEVMVSPEHSIDHICSPRCHCGVKLGETIHDTLCNTFIKKSARVAPRKFMLQIG